MNIQSFDKPLLARCGQLLETHLKEVSENGLRLLSEALGKEYKELCKAGFFFHDVGKCEVSIQRALYEDKKPPITHTHLSLIFFYSWLRDYLRKELYEVLEESKTIRGICFGIISHHSPPHMGLDKNIFSQLFKKKITVAQEIFDILNKCGFLIKKDLLEQTYNSLIEGYKKNCYEFLFEYHLKDDIRKDFVIFYNALVKADWYSAMGQKVSRVQNLKSINLPRLIEVERSKIHRYIADANKFEENIILELPTGFGKTYLGFEYGLKTNRKRIIYTLPVTTIIEDVYNKLVEKLGKGYVEWYTSRYFVLKSLKEEISESEYLEAKYFDKPITITTLDQILLAFLSVDRYPLKESAIYDSCIILDEPQLYSPLMLFLFSGFLQYYKSEFNFAIMTATLPDFLKKKIESFCKEPFLRQKENIFKKFLRTFFNLDFFGQSVFLEKGIKKDIVKFLNRFISGKKKISVIFNTVEKAQRFYKSLPKDFPKFLFHARFIYRDRVKKLQELKEKLKNPPIIVISTQAIEAGVDVSFDIMFREIAPLDSLIQSAGRVNRYSENPQPSPIFIFGKAEDFLPYKEYQLEITSQILPNLENVKSELDFYNSLRFYWERIKGYLIKDEQKAKELIHLARKVSPFSINIEEEKIDLRETYFKVSVIPVQFFSDIMKKWEGYKKIDRKSYWQRKKIVSEIQSYMVEVPYFAKAGKKNYKDFIIWEEEDFKFPLLELKYDSILGVLSEEDINFRFI